MLKKLGLVILIAGLFAGSAFASYIVKTENNPVANRFYTVYDTASGFTVSSVSNSGAVSSQITGTGNVLGLKVNPAGTKLYLSVDDGANSRIMIYSLNSAGDPITTNPVTMSFAAYNNNPQTDYLALPRGLDLVNYNGQDLVLYVADASSAGVMHVFNLTGSAPAWAGAVSIKNDFNGGTYTSALHSVAIRPIAGNQWQLFISQRASAGKVFSYIVTFNGANVTQTPYSGGNGYITNLQYPFFIKVSPDGSRLYVATKGDQGDIMAFSTADLSFQGRVMAGIGESTAGWGWNGFDLSPDGKNIYYVQAQNATETSTNLYKADATALGGGNIVSAASLANVVFSPADSVLVDPMRSKVWVMDSGTGSFTYYTVPGITPAEVANVRINAGSSLPLVVGSNATITWKTFGDVLNVKLEYSTAGASGPWTGIAIVPNSGTANWTVPNTPSFVNTYVRASDAAALQINGLSTPPATIARQITVSQPNGSTSYPLQSATPIPVQWDNVSINGSLPYSKVNIYYGSSASGPWSWIASPSNTGSYSWSIASNIALTNGTYYIKVVGDNGSGGDTTNYGVSAPFALVSNITFTQPAATAAWHDGAGQSGGNGFIVYSASGGNFDHFDLYWRTDGGTWTKGNTAPIAKPASYPASYTWTVNTNLASSSQMQVKLVAVNTSGGAVGEGLSPTFMIDNNAPNPPAAPATETHGLQNNAWENSVNQPSFTWTAATDNPNPNSGIAGYYVYIGTSASADPATAGTRVVSASYPSPYQLPDGSPTYLIVRSIDGAGNLSAPQTMFTVKYDSYVPYFPGNPVISSSTHPDPAKTYPNTTPIFVWTAAVDSTPGSGLANPTYYYKLDQTLTVTAAQIYAAPDGSTNTLGASYTQPIAAGTYYFHLIARDTAGNMSSVYTYKINAGSALQPTVTAITPNIGQVGGTVNATITGTNFVTGQTIQLTRNGQIIGAVPGSVTVVSPTQATCTFNLSGAQIGLWNVDVVSGGLTGELYHGFSIVSDINAMPVISGLYPHRSPNSHTTDIIIVGSRLLNVSAVELETNPAAAMTYSVISDTQILATVPAGKPVGTYHIVASNSFGPSQQTAADTFEVMSGNENPAVASQVKDLRAAAGDKKVTLDWTNPADNDMATLEVRRYLTAFPIDQNSAPDKTIFTSIPAPGATNEVVDTGLTNGTTYYYVAFIKDTSGNWSVVDFSAPDINAVKATPGNLPAPTIVSIDPNNGVQGKTVTAVNVIGTNFVTGETVKLTKTGQTDIPATTTYYSSTYLSCTIAIPLAAATGTWNVVVGNPAPDTQTATLENGFTVYAPGTNSPTITSIAPAKGQIGTTVAANLAGTNFAAGATVYLAKTGQTNISMDMTGATITPTNISGSFAIPSAAQTGPWTVIVTNTATDKQTAELVNGFNITSEVVTVPTITSIDPNNGVQGKTVTAVNLIGTNFVTGETVKLSKTGQADITAEAAYYSATYLSCTIPIPAGAAVGTWDVVVSSPNTQTATLSGGFTVNASGSNAPTLTKITPVKGSLGSTVTASLEGTNFASGATVKLAKTGQADITMNMTGATITPTNITGPLVIPSAAKTGDWTVMVTNTGTDKQTAQLVNGFNITSEAAPVSPDVPLNLISTKSGNNAILTWSAPASGEPTGGYRVFRGTSPTTITTQIGNDVAAGTHTQTDTGAVTTPDSYYYVVKAFSGSTVSGPSNVAYLLKEQIEYSASLGGKTLISIPTKTSYTTLASIINDIEGIDVTTLPGATTAPTKVSLVARFNPATQTYENLYWSGSEWLSDRTDSAMPPMVAGEGVEIRALLSFRHVFAGAYDPNFSLPLVYAAGRGNKNLISVPYNTNYATLASMVQQIEGIDVTTLPGATTAPTKVGLIARFNHTTQTYENLYWSGSEWLSDRTDSAMPPVVIGEGFEMNILQNFTYKPSVQ